MFERSRLGVGDIFSWLRFKGRALTEWSCLLCQDLESFMSVHHIHECLIQKCLSYIVASSWRVYHCEVDNWESVHSVVFQFQIHLILRLTVSFISYNKVKNKSACLICLCPQGLVFLLLLSSVPVPWDNKGLCGKLYSSYCCVLIDKTHVRQSIMNQQVFLDI